MWAVDVLNKKWPFVIQYQSTATCIAFYAISYFLNIPLSDDWSTFLLNWAKLQEAENEAILRPPDVSRSYKIYEDSYKIYENCFWNIKISWIPRTVKWAFIYFEKLPFHFHFMYRLRVFPSFLLDRSCCFYTVVCRQWQFALWWNKSKWNVSFCCHDMQLPTSLSLKFSVCLFTVSYVQNTNFINTGLFISPSGISELDCATTKTDTAERSISIGRESLKVFFFVLGALAYFQVPPLGVVVTKNGVHSE